MQLILHYDSALEKFYKSHPKSKKPIKAWLKPLRARKWQSLIDVLSFYQTARYRDENNVSRIAFPVGDFYISCRPWVQENTTEEDGAIHLFIAWLGDKKKFRLNCLGGIELTMYNLDQYLD